jgi:hypothetical protein
MLSFFLDHWFLLLWLLPIVITSIAAYSIHNIFVTSLSTNLLKDTYLRSALSSLKGGLVIITVFSLIPVLGFLVMFVMIYMWYQASVITDSVDYLHKLTKSIFF